MATGGKGKPATGGGHVVAMPHPGRGHINPMINLCVLLARKEMITITLVLTEEWLGLIGSPPEEPGIRVRTIPNVVPSEQKRAADYIGFIEAVHTKMEAPFDRLLDRLDLPVSCIIADLALPWMQLVGRRRNIPVASLYPSAPSPFYNKFWLDFEPSDLLISDAHFPERNAPERGEDSATVGSKTSRIEQYFLKALAASTKVQAIIFTSFYELQPHTISCLRDKQLPAPGIPIYTIGPCIPYMFLKVPSSKPIPPYMDWLDSQPPGSVLYVSWGSFLSTSDEQLLELSEGLRASCVRYLWTARRETLSLLQEADGDEKGFIVPWCDQLKVLCHSSVAGFLTHCGWNSTMESIYAGVPMLTFPLAFDQFQNSKLIVEDWGVGLALKCVEGVDNVVGREEIARSVKRLMDLNGDEGKELRTRAKELQKICRSATEAGGSTENNINAFVGEFSLGQCRDAD